MYKIKLKTEAISCPNCVLFEFESANRFCPDMCGQWQSGKLFFSKIYFMLNWLLQLIKEKKIPIQLQIQIRLSNIYLCISTIKI